MNHRLEYLASQGAASWYFENYLTINIFLNLVGLICFLGIWQRKKWGVPALLVNAIAGEIINREAGLSDNSFALILTVIAALLLCFSLFSKNNNKS
ncbi:MAG: hypothetical protein QNJ38_23210 [Prochloraceae cyanobacterium]|nr:hypothetical protein [Prochloraceae cyanobacterium]